MYFSIGNFEDNYLSSLGISTGSITEEEPIYGIRFQNYIDYMYQNKRLAINDADVIQKMYSGIRLGKSRNYTFEASTPSIAGQDDFITNNDDPFCPKECATVYNSDTEMQEVVSYEGDPTWETDKANPEYNIMIEIPHFYFAIPDVFTFLVSPSYKTGFVEAFSDGMFDKLYISKYNIDSSGISRPNQNTTYTGPADVTNTSSTLCTTLSSNGLNMFDRNVLHVLNLLLFIKYGTLDISTKINSNATFSTSTSTINTYSGNADTILGKDGKTTSSNSVTVNFGLVNYNQVLEVVKNIGIYHQTNNNRRYIYFDGNTGITNGNANNVDSDYFDFPSYTQNSIAIYNYYNQYCIYAGLSEPGFTTGSSYIYLPCGVRYDTYTGSSFASAFSYHFNTTLYNNGKNTTAYVRSYFTT